jgi:nitrogen fixation NifU-like protein
MKDNWRVDMKDAKIDSELDRLVDDLQSRIDEEEEKVFSKKAIAEARAPSNMGPLEAPDGHARRTGSCGDTMDMFVRVVGDKVTEISFLTDGCGATVACGSMLSKMASERTLEQVMDLSDQDLLEALDGLPEENHHCARLAVAAMHGAVKATRFYNEMKMVDEDLERLG